MQLALDNLKAQAASNSSSLHGRINFDVLAVAGHSRCGSRKMTAGTFHAAAVDANCVVMLASITSDYYAHRIVTCTHMWVQSPSRMV
jgi:hypothetical protein